MAIYGYVRCSPAKHEKLAEAEIERFARKARGNRRPIPKREAQRKNHTDRKLRRQFKLLLSRLNEQQRRWMVALESKKIGHGGDRFMAAVSRLSVETIRRGRRELDNHLVGRPRGRVRLPGAGQPPVEKKTLGIGKRLERLVEDETGGEPSGGKRFVRSSLRSLAERLGRGSPTTVGRLMRQLGFSPRVNVKRFTGLPHPDREKQFQYLRRQRRKFQQAGCPTISVDAKKKELVGNFHNGGRKWSRGAAEEVNAHNFPQDAQCQAVPYGIYDTARNAGHVCVGTSAETGEFAVDALRQWWRTAAAKLARII
jgi:hypothetical protein